MFSNTFTRTKLWPHFFFFLDLCIITLLVKSFLRFADDHEKEWVKQLDEHMETRPRPLPVIQSGMNLEEKAKAFGFRRKPNFKVDFFYLFDHFAV